MNHISGLAAAYTHTRDTLNARGGCHFLLHPAIPLFVVGRHVILSLLSCYCHTVITNVICQFVPSFVVYARLIELGSNIACDVRDPSAPFRLIPANPPNRLTVSWPALPVLPGTVISIVMRSFPFCVVCSRLDFHLRFSFIVAIGNGCLK